MKNFVLILAAFWVVVSLVIGFFPTDKAVAPPVSALLAASAPVVVVTPSSSVSPSAIIITKSVIDTPADLHDEAKNKPTLRLKLSKNLSCYDYPACMKAVSAQDKAGGWYGIN